MRERARTSLATAVVDVWKREVGELSTRNFAHRLAASEDLVLRLDIFRKLDKHTGCVNTVSFNADGDILISGSDDRRVILWDWESGKVKLSFHSAHHNNVFQAKFMPYSEDRSIVTCAADGQVRHAQILERGKVETKLLANHHGRAHKLAIEPGSPHIFYTCGEDGLVQHIDLRTGVATKLLTCQPIRTRSFIPFFRLNTIAIDPRNPNLFSVAGEDEFARLFDIRKYKCDGSTDFGQPVEYFCPRHLRGDKLVGITGLAFSDQSELLVSYYDEFIYLFSKNMGLGPHSIAPFSPSSDSDAEMSHDYQKVSSPSDMDADGVASPQVFKGHRNCKTVKGVNFFGPKCEYVVSGSDCGRIFIWKKKDGELIRVMEADNQVVNCIEPHPHTTMLASSGIENDIKIWTPKAIERASLPTNIEKVPIPRRIGFFPIGEFDDDDDESSNDYLYYAGGASSEEDSEDLSDEEEEEDEEDEDEDNDNGNDIGCESLDGEDEDDGDEEFYDSIIDDCDDSFDDIDGDGDGDSDGDDKNDGDAYFDD
ncbi:hypothetical protein ACH5RR_002477 [Cinchona calisaya]|uniref:DDB1- and CUL4-associated factor 8 n=1 Tax=Cinchona calisaya TaxID=153742 RepID=A0ABD3B6P0_9GENT